MYACTSNPVFWQVSASVLRKSCLDVFTAAFVALQIAPPKDAWLHGLL
jgi:hypothetical protein